MTHYFFLNILFFSPQTHPQGAGAYIRILENIKLVFPAFIKFFLKKSNNICYHRVYNL